MSAVKLLESKSGNIAGRCVLPEFIRKFTIPELTRIRSRVYFCSKIKAVTRATFAGRRTFRRQRADRSLTVFVDG